MLGRGLQGLNRVRRREHKKRCRGKPREVCARDASAAATVVRVLLRVDTDRVRVVVVPGSSNLISPENLRITRGWGAHMSCSLS